MAKIQKTIIKMVLQNYNLEELAYYYLDRNGTFEAIINEYNKISCAPKHRRMQNTKRNRNIVAYYAKQMITENKISMENCDDNSDKNIVQTEIMSAELNDQYELSEKKPQNAFRNRDEKMEKCRNTRKTRLKKDIIKMILENYNLEDLLYYYIDKNGTFEDIINKYNKITCATKHRQLQNTKINRKLVAYYAKTMIKENISQIPMEHSDHNFETNKVSTEIISAELSDQSSEKKPQNVFRNRDEKMEKCRNSRKTRLKKDIIKMILENYNLEDLSYYYIDKNGTFEDIINKYNKITCAAKHRQLQNTKINRSLVAYYAKTMIKENISQIPMEHSDHNFETNKISTEMMSAELSGRSSENRQNTSICRDEKLEKGHNSLKTRLQKNVVKMILKNYNLEDLLYYYSDKNGTFEAIINRYNKITCAAKYRQLQNTKVNRRHVAYYAKAMMKENISQIPMELSDHNYAAKCHTDISAEIIGAKLSNRSYEEELQNSFGHRDEKSINGTEENEEHHNIVDSEEEESYVEQITDRSLLTLRNTVQLCPTNAGTFTKSATSEETYTMEERVKIIQAYYENGRSIEKAHRTLREYFGVHNRPTENTIWNLVQKFEQFVK